MMSPSICGLQSDHSHWMARRWGHMPVISRYTGMEKSTSPVRVGRAGGREGSGKVGEGRQEAGDKR